MSLNAHAVIGPGVTVSICIDHRGDVNVKVLQYLLQLPSAVVWVEDLKHKQSQILTFQKRPVTGDCACAISIKMAVWVDGPLWQTTGRRLERSTPRREYHSPPISPYSLCPPGSLVTTGDTSHSSFRVNVRFKLLPNLQVCTSTLQTKYWWRVVASWSVNQGKLVKTWGN